MCVRPLGGARLTSKVATLPTHVSALVSFVCKDQDEEEGLGCRKGLHIATFICKDWDWGPER